VTTIFIQNDPTSLVACVTSMLLSLVMGLSFDTLLDVLVYTNASDTPKKAYWQDFEQ